MEIEAQNLDPVVKRLQRAQGQIGGIIRMIQDGRECKDIVTQIAAVSKAIDRAGFAVISNGLQQCIKDADQVAGKVDTGDLEKLFLSLA